MAVTVLAAAGCGGSSSDSSTAESGGFAGSVQKDPKPVPPLALKDSLGHEINIDSYRGKAVLVTFIYDHCPDVCPIIVGNLHTAQNQLGAEAKKLQIVAVSVDPKGDTPKTVKAFLKQHQMTGRMQYLVGSRPQLENVWSDWNIVSKSSPKKGNPDLVEHSALIYGISGSGKIDNALPSELQARPNRPRRPDAGGLLGPGAMTRRRRIGTGLVLLIIGGVVVAEITTSGGGQAAHPAPALPKQVLSGHPVDMASLRGKPALINFWASWCGPCEQEAPELRRFADGIGPRASLVGIDWNDSSKSARTFIEESHWTYSVLRDPGGSVGNAYGLNGLPTTFVLDREGNIVQKLQGPQTVSTLKQALSSVG